MSSKDEAKVVGEVVMSPLDQVKVNDWNPNEMTPELLASIRQGFIEDGWLSSQALLIWQTDKAGRKKNIIIDGEHRWKVAKDLQMMEGPMVFLKKLSREQAMALTVKLDNKRGKFNKQKLSAVVRQVMEADIGSADIALSLGFAGEELLKLTAEPAIPIGGPEPVGAAPAALNPGVTSTNPNVKMVPLYFSTEQHARFVVRIKELGDQHGTETITDTILSALDI